MLMGDTTRMGMKREEETKIFHNKYKRNIWEAWDGQAVVGNATGGDLYKLVYGGPNSMLKQQV
jgi:hypothetical protein